ncbi:pancreatic secretory granule membrane major glycoprotein GP2-like [Discoglossus pictus]
MKFLCVLVLVALLKHTEAACYSGIEHVACSESSCSGSCSPGNGCTCSDGLTTCIPSACDLDANECCPDGLFWDDTNSCCTDTLVCSPSCLSDEVCVNDTNDAVCVCNNLLHKNETLKDLKTTVDCAEGTMTVSVSKCLLGYLGYDYTTFRLKNDPDINCSAPYPDILNNQRTQSFQIKAKKDICGNIMTLDSSKVYYTNVLFIDILNKPLITINPIEMNFTCSYNLTMQTSLDVILHPVASTTYLNASNGEGSYPLTIAAYKNSEFNIPFEETDNVNVGSDIYLGLFITGADGDNFALRAVQCIATPSNNRNDPTFVQFVSGGCLVDGDVDTALINNGDSLEAKFRVSAFVFDGYGEVHIFCDARLCDKASGNCTVCQNGKSSEQGTGEVSVSLRMEDTISFGSSGTDTVVSSAALAASILMLLLNKLF